MLTQIEGGYRAERWGAKTTAPDGWQHLSNMCKRIPEILVNIKTNAVMHYWLQYHYQLPSDDYIIYLIKSNVWFQEVTRAYVITSVWNWSKMVLNHISKFQKYLCQCCNFYSAWRLNFATTSCAPVYPCSAPRAHSSIAGKDATRSAITNLGRLSA